MHWRLNQNPDAVGERETAILIAVIDLHRQSGSVTYADIIEATGICRSEVHRFLSALRTRGLVEWETGKHGTLRPVVEVVR